MTVSSWFALVHQSVPSQSPESTSYQLGSGTIPAVARERRSVHEPATDPKGPPCTLAGSIVIVNCQSATKPTSGPRSNSSVVSAPGASEGVSNPVWYVLPLVATCTVVGPTVVAPLFAIVTSR